MGLAHWNVEIVDGVSGNPVTCDYAILDTTSAKQKIDSVWWVGVDWRESAQDGEWNWAKIVQECRYDYKNQCICLKTTDGAIQAAMIVGIDGKSQLADGKAVAVKFLASAPNNRRDGVAQPIYRYCGSQLLLYAAWFSFDRELGGAVIASPVPGSEQFYLDHGFIETPSVDDEGAVIYELTSESSIQWLTAEGLLDDFKNIKP